MSDKGKFACRACGGTHVETVLSLGQSALANALVAKEDLGKPDRTYPLDLAFCKTCALVQITETVPPEEMFRDYAYLSSFSGTMLRHAETIANRLVDVERLTDKSLVVEVASNDGYLLQYYKKRGVPVLGIEPARNIAKVAVDERGIPTLTEFFGRDLAKTIRERGQFADVIHANNVFAHVPDIPGFVAGFETILKDHGIAVVEAPYVRDMIEHCEFDTIYHEHLSYYSLTAVDRLVARHGLVVRDVERIPMHGGSLRYFFAKAAQAKRSPAVEKMLAEEQALGVDKVEFYRGFAAKVEALKQSLRSTLLELKKSGKTIAAYGAAAKGVTLLTYFGIGADVIDFVADRSTVKQGRWMPGVRLPIVAPEKMLEDKPDYCVLLTWNFAQEILAQQKAYREAGGKFVIPIPDVRIV